jgi:hypothetical protein
LAVRQLGVGEPLGYGSTPRCERGELWVEDGEVDGEGENVEFVDAGDVGAVEIGEFGTSMTVTGIPFGGRLLRLLNSGGGNNSMVLSEAGRGGRGLVKA